jgi:hypothetical protein
MPLSKNGKFYYLLNGEHIDFKLAPFNEAWIDDRMNILRLAMPSATHISSKPFKGTNYKVMACRGRERCPICASGHNPTDLYPVNLVIAGLDDEVIMEMPPTAHSVVVTEVQKMLDNGATYHDILDTEMRLHRMARGVRPTHECFIITETGVPHRVEEEEDIPIITDEDKNLLRKIDALLKTGKYANPRGTVMRTLREKYNWPDDKIDLAFETVLTDEGYFVG